MEGRRDAVTRPIVEAFLHAFLYGQDAKCVLDFFTPDISYLSTATTEQIHGIKCLEYFLIKQNEYTALPLRYCIHTFIENPITDSICSCQFRLEVWTDMPEDNALYQNILVGMVFVQCEGAYLICNMNVMHMSTNGSNEQLYFISSDEREMRRNKEHYENKLSCLISGRIMEGVVGLYIKPELPICMISKKVARSLGFSSRHALVNYSGGLFERLVHPSDSAKLRKAVNKAISRSGAIDLQYRLVNKEGQTIWVYHKAYSSTLPNGETILMGVVLDVSNQGVAHEKLMDEAKKDSLTNIFNRREVVRLVDKEMKRSGAGTLLLVDIDNFKRLNDTHGHLMGDEALIGLANLLRENVRSTDIVGRLGGDEFIAFLPHLKHANEARERALELCKAFHARMTLIYPQLNIGVSIGVVIAQPGDTFMKLYERADCALYCAKESGKGNVCLSGA